MYFTFIVFKLKQNDLIKSLVVFLPLSSTFFMMPCNILDVPIASWHFFRAVEDHRSVQAQM